MEIELVVTLKMILSVTLSVLLLLSVHLCYVVLMKPKRLRSKLQRQGIRGPSPSFLLGNIPEMKRIQLLQLQSTPKSRHHHHHLGGDALSHDWSSTVFPYFKQWRNQYGSIFMYSTGNIQMLHITDPDMVKEMSLCVSLVLGKPSFLSKENGPLLGQGILTSSGRIWAHQRKIIAPELYLDKVKGMLNLMVESTSSMIKSWEDKIEGSKEGTSEISVDYDLRSLSADIISRACFGSSYSQGKEIFLKLRNLQRIMSKRSIFVGVPGLRYIPSKNNREIWRLEKEIHSMILNVVKQRYETTREKDLLQMILEAAKNNGDSENLWARDKFIVDNCKNIYFAGHETTAITASWSLMLLSAHPDWQDRVRAEVLEICGDCLPDFDTLGSMKTLTMVIQETLRLYPPASFVAREAFQDMKFKDLVLPKGINVWVSIPMLHQNPELWGEDANQFNPERFANGVLGACKIPQAAYIPFGMGTRTCLGQHLAMLELKAILSLIISKFCFSLSPSYQHSPVFRFVIESELGVKLLVKRE